MINLVQSEPYHNYRISWILGNWAAFMDEYFDIHEECILHVLQNFHDEGLIVSVNGRTIAMSFEVADRIRVEPVYTY